MTQHTPDFIRPKAIPAKALSSHPKRQFAANRRPKPAHFLAQQDAPDLAFVRHAIGVFVAAWIESNADLFVAKTAQVGPHNLEDLLRAAAAQSSRPSPYGRFPPAPLTLEDLDGPAYRVSPDLAQVFGASLSAALEYAHLILAHPGDSGPQAEAALLRAGWPAAALPDLTNMIETAVLQVRLHALQVRTFPSIQAFA